jgi:hypothetical protein
MKILYEAANAVEAHMIVDLLGQQGITGHVLGGHLQGAIGELPAAGLVRVTVDETDFDRAKPLIDAWNLAQPLHGDPSDSQAGTRHGGKGWQMLALGLLVGIGGTYAALRMPVRQDGLDHNKNGVLDEVWTHAANGAAIKYEADRNLDGRADYIGRYGPGGQMTETAALDDDFDGVFETQMTYSHNSPDLSQTDTDGDGFADLATRFRHGVPEQITYLSPVTGQPLRVEHMRLGKVLEADVDADKDGVLDTVLRYDALGEVASRSPLSR